LSRENAATAGDNRSFTVPTGIATIHVHDGGPETGPTALLWPSLFTDGHATWGPLALYFSYCRTCGTSWVDPNMTAFQMWLRVAQSPRRSVTVRSPTPARSDNHINLISYVVSEMFKFAAAEGFWSSDKLGVLFETAQVRFCARDRGQAATYRVTLRRRQHTLAESAGVSTVSLVLSWSGRIPNVRSR
jgi:hypothetical protein